LETSGDEWKRTALPSGKENTFNTTNSGPLRAVKRGVGVAERLINQIIIDGDADGWRRLFLYDDMEG
jgi:hypothetical protein